LRTHGSAEEDVRRLAFLWCVGVFVACLSYLLGWHDGSELFVRRSDIILHRFVVASFVFGRLGLKRGKKLLVGLLVALLESVPHLPKLGSHLGRLGSVAEVDLGFIPFLGAEEDVGRLAPFGLVRVLDLVTAALG